MDTQTSEAQVQIFEHLPNSDSDPDRNLSSTICDPYSSTFSYEDFHFENFDQQLFDLNLNVFSTCDIFPTNNSHTDQQSLLLESGNQNQNSTNDPLNCKNFANVPHYQNDETVIAGGCVVGLDGDGAIKAESTPTTSLTSLMQIPNDQLYTSDANTIDVIFNDLADKSIISQSESSSVFSLLQSAHSSPVQSPLSSPSPSPSSPCSSSFTDSSLSNNLSGKVKTTKRKSKEVPDECNLTMRQLRKREQNRQAALRYRLKKKKEAEDNLSKENELIADLKHLQNEIRKEQQSYECYESLIQEMLSNP